MQRVCCSRDARAVRSIILRLPMDTVHSLNQNHLLAALPDAEFERIAPHLERVAMPMGEVLYESGG